MATVHEKERLFRALHVAGRPLVLVNCWDAGSAKAVAAGGAAAIATASWAVAAANAYPDGEHLPLELAIGNLARIARAVELPVTADLESGYGEQPDDVGATVEKALHAGVIGCNLEDSHAHGGGIRPAREQALRLKAARDAATRLALPLFINARADAFLKSDPTQHDDTMLDEVIARAALYAEHGADGLFVPGLADPALIKRLVRATSLPVNLMGSDASPPPRLLAKLGVARISYGPHPYLRMMNQLQAAAAELLT